MSCFRGCCPDQITHYRSVGISATALPSREGSPRVAQIEATEKRWTKEFATMKELKKQGIVPKHTDGVDRLVSEASTRYEIERGRTFSKEQIAKHEYLLGKDLK